MKTFKSILLVLCGYFLLGLTSGMAQNERHFVRAGYGVAPVQSIFYGFLKGFLSDITWDDPDKSGLWQVGYSYKVSEKIEVGLVGAYTYMGQKGRYRNNPDRPRPDYDYSTVVATEWFKYYSLIPTVQANWKTTENTKIYSGLAFGGFYGEKFYWYENQDAAVSTMLNYAGHVNLIGVRYGRRFAGFAELGFGFHGMLSGGISYGF